MSIIQTRLALNQVSITYFLPYRLKYIYSYLLSSQWPILGTAFLRYLKGAYLLYLDFSDIARSLNISTIFPDLTTGVMLCILGSILVLVSKDDPRDYRGASVKRTMVTAIS